MEGAAIIQLIGSILGAGALVAIVNGIFNRKKLSADAVNVINEAATTAVSRVEHDNTRLRRENQETRLELREYERKVDRLGDALRAYVAYAARQATVIRTLGGVIEDPPSISEELLS